ncbi:ABC transporter permease [Halonatronum saccharophilum]|uniref:ABC transporter permease n=1 Tax=Halonatronum saccharophilum TaxID=150060 RepID=UPI0004B2EDFE|nr:sugar ABC transporter permease [Halonatronum saccharophilum]
MNTKIKKKLIPYILLLPSLSIIVLLFLGGLIIALTQSLGYFPLIGLNNISLEYFRGIFNDEQFISSLGYTLYISVVSSTLSVIIGVLLAYQLLKLPKENKFISTIYKLPIIVPHAVGSLIIFIIFTQSGSLSRIFYSFGFIEDISSFPRMVFDPWGIGIILVYLWKQIPFVALMVYTILRGINSSWEGAALNLGANKRQIFWNIYLPLSMPTILSSFIIIFAFSFGAFEIPFLLGPTNPRTLPVLAYHRYTSLNIQQRPYAMAILITIAVISTFLIILYKKVVDLSRI